MIGWVTVTAGIVVMAWPEMREAVNGGESPGLPILIATYVVGSVIAAIGLALTRAAFGRFDTEGRTQTWFVVVTSVPVLGRLIRWIVLRSERETVGFDEG